MHKLKSLYESCKDVVRKLHQRDTFRADLEDKLNDLGLDPLLPQVKTLLDLFGTFDLVPAPEVDADVEPFEWSGSWSESYQAPQELIAIAREAHAIKTARSLGGRKWNKHVHADTLDDDDVPSTRTHDEPRRERLTKALAWLHSRGASPRALPSIELTPRCRRACQLQHRRRRGRSRFSGSKPVAVSGIRRSTLQGILRGKADPRSIHIRRSRHTRRYYLALQVYRRET